jgi:hypothetical protein
MPDLGDPSKQCARCASWLRLGSKAHVGRCLNAESGNQYTNQAATCPFHKAAIAVGAAPVAV